MSIARVAVLGAGRMGCGIAQVFLAAGHPVTLFDAMPGALDAAPGKIRSFFELLDEDTSVMVGLRCESRLSSAVVEADLIIEAIAEKLEAKQQLFSTVETACRHDAVLATNTSAIPIGSIAESLKARQRFVGMHFWNPPHLVPLVELIQTHETDVNVIAWSMSLLSSIGMSPVHVLKDIPGFIGNRLQHALKREAIALVASGVCDAETIDRVVKEGFGARLPVLGPLEQSDLVGLDLTLQIHRVLIADLDVTPGPHAFLQAKVDAGQLGMRCGVGFRIWSEDEAKAVQSRLDRHLVTAARERLQLRRAASSGNDG